MLHSISPETLDKLEALMSLVMHRSGGIDWSIVLTLSDGTSPRIVPRNAPPLSGGADARPIIPVPIRGTDGKELGRFEIRSAESSAAMDGDLLESAGFLASAILAPEMGGRALETERERLSGIFQKAPMFLAVLRGPDFVFELVNDAYYQLVGRRELIGRPVFEALPEVRDQGFAELLEGVVTTGEPYVGREVPVLVSRRKDGSMEKVYVDFVYAPLTEVDQTRSGVVAYGSDVTDHVLARKEIERLLKSSEEARAEIGVANQQLQESAVELEAQAEELMQTAAELEERTAEAEAARHIVATREEQLRTLADAIPTLAWTARADGFIDWYNAQWYEYTGTTPAQMEGWGWQSVHHPEALPFVLDQWRDSITSGRTFEMTFPLRGRHGGYRRFLTRVTPLRDETGKVIRWFGTNTDVEAERIALDAAESANKAKTDFLATMSHELRTPLNSIGGYAELLDLEIHGSLNDSQREAIRRIHRSQRHLLGLINEILNYAKLEAGTVEFESHDVNLRDAMTSAASLVAPQSLAKGIELGIADECDSTLTARGDSEKLSQILINLLSNAVKFTPPGGRIEMSCELRNDHAIIVVRDTGIGIPADKLDAIFDPFVQVRAELTRPHEGTGLGLAISRDLARGMNGDLTVESIEGKGSEFTLKLPWIAEKN